MHKICFTISLFHASTCFEQHVHIVRRSKLYYTASGIITPISGRPLHGKATYRCDVCIALSSPRNFRRNSLPFLFIAVQFLSPVMLIAYIMLLPTVLSRNVVVGDAFPNNVSCPTIVYMCASTTPHPGTERIIWAWCVGIWWVKAYVAWNKVPSAILSFVILCTAFLFLSRLFVFCRYPFQMLAWLPGILNENFFFGWLPWWHLQIGHYFFFRNLWLFRFRGHAIGHYVNCVV